jgi:hypothetical protein
VRLYIYKSGANPSAANTSAAGITLGSVYTNFVSIVCLCCLSLTATKINSLSQATINRFPNEFYVQFYLLIAPNLVVLIMSAVYYVQYPKILEFVFHSVKERLFETRVFELNS